MISIRRFIASMLVGGLLVIGSAAQASAQSPSHLDRAIEGVAIGLQAVSGLIESQGGVVVVDDALDKALGVYDAWMAKHEFSNRQGHGQGPMRAQEVHEALLAGEIPGQIGKSDDSKLAHLDGVYGQLKKQSDDAIKAKAEKNKPNNGKSNKGKSEGKGGGKSGSNAGGNAP